MPKILIFDDEKSIREMIKFSLEMKGMECFEALSAQNAISEIYANRPDLIILDWMMPDVSGIEFLRRIKRDPKVNDIPVILLTAKVDENNVVTGLDAGAEDYIKKPFSTKELIARINSILRRNNKSDLIEVMLLKLDCNSRLVYVDNKSVNLGPTEFKLLKFLIENKEKTFTREQILDRVWGANVYIDERTVDVHIRRIRKSLSIIKIDTNSLHPSDYIQTVRGLGYRLSSK